MLSYITTGFLVASFSVGVYCYGRISSVVLRVFILLVGLSSFAELAFEVFPALSGVPIRLYYCLLLPAEYGIYILLFMSSATRTPLLKAWLGVSFIGLVLLSLYQIAFDLSSLSAATNVFLVSTILTLIIVLVYFGNLLRSEKVIYLNRDPLFWIATGLLFYNTGNLVSTGFYHKLLDNPSTTLIARNLYYLNYILGIFQSILFSIAFVVAARKPKHA